MVIRFDVININLLSKPDWFLKKTHLKLVPVIEHNGFVLNESITTADYLDDKYPDIKLHPNSLEEKAIDKYLVEKFFEVTLKITFIMFSMQSNKIFL